MFCCKRIKSDSLLSRHDKIWYFLSKIVKYVLRAKKMAPCAPRATLCPTQAHIVIHVFCATLSSGGYFRPYNVSIGAISAILVNFFHKAKLHFLQKEPFPSTESAETLCVDSQTPSESGPKSWQMAICGSKNIVRARGEKGLRRLPGEFQ